MGLLDDPNVRANLALSAGLLGGGNMAAFGSLLMVTTLRPDPTAMIFWFGGIAALGVFTAIPIKRQLINQVDQPLRMAAPALRG